MARTELHPSVEEFKKFVKKNPKIIQEVRKEKLTWQEIYEDWYLLGEEDPRWQEFRSDSKVSQDSERKTDWVGQIMSVVKKMDVNQMEVHISNLSQVLDTIQGVISQFQGSSPSQQPQKVEPPKHPFMFRKD